MVLTMDIPVNKLGNRLTEADCGTYITSTSLTVTLFTDKTVNQCAAHYKTNKYPLSVDYNEIHSYTRVKEGQHLLISFLNS